MQRIGEIAAQRVNDNVNDNDISLKRNINDNVNDGSVMVKIGSYHRKYHTEAIAQRVIQKLDAPQSYRFFLKCAWNLPEAVIWDIIEYATTNPKIKEPVKYVVSVLHYEMQKRGKA